MLTVLVGKNIDMNETDLDEDNQEITISRDIGTLSFSRDQFEFEDGEEETHFQVHKSCAFLMRLDEQLYDIVNWSVTPWTNF